MIPSLTSLLKEVQDKPKAIFLAGPAGSGKSHMIKNLLPSSLKVLNLDRFYEKLLKKANLGLKQKDFTSDQLSKASSLMAKAHKKLNKKFEKHSQDKIDLAIDGTGAAVGPLLKRKKELEDLGYETFMIMLYVSPLSSLKRNQERKRNLLPNIVLRTWRDTIKNINTYKTTFGNNFVLINNDPEDANKDYSDELISPYLDNAKFTSKEKSPEQAAKSKASKDQINKDIQALIKQNRNFDSMDKVKQKLNSFLN